MSVQSPRRVSYVLPPPTSPPPVLGLPPLGITRVGRPGPFYSQVDAPSPSSSPTERAKLQKFTHAQGSHPRHRLAVQALTIDLSTSWSSAGASSGKHAADAAAGPAGLLYTGGRDGLVCSWELGMPTKKRKFRYGRGPPLGGQTEDYDSDSSSSNSENDDDEVERLRSLKENLAENVEGLGGAYGARKGMRHSNGQSQRQSTRRPYAGADLEGIPVEERWEVDDERIQSIPPPSAKFRQCVQSHTDWVNDIVLCDYNRVLVSASSDSLVLAWNPHSTSHEDQVTPKQIGHHGDYVRCLASAREASWVASGGFDRKVKIWDLGQGRSNAVVELATAPASIYSLSATPDGSLIAAGSPERLIRVWDPKSRNLVSRLGGHTDNVRSVLLAEDGKWLLSASSDSTVKLWSLTAQKCLHTFSHHSSSVWSLFSQHPSLEIFYSGDRSGNICKIDLEGTGDPGEGECIVLARDAGEDGGEGRVGPEGITQLVAQDDSWVWAADGSSNVKRWRDVAPRRRRAGPSFVVSKREEKLDHRSQQSEPSDSTDCLLSPQQGLPIEPVTNERARNGPVDVSFLEGMTSPLARTTSSPTPRLISHNSGGFLPNGRPSSVRPHASPMPLFPSVRPAHPPEHDVRNSYRQSYGPSASSPGNLTPILSSPLSTTLFDIPYDSLVPLTSPEDSYFSPAFPQPQEADVATIYSTASVLSIHQTSYGGPLNNRPGLPASISSRSYFRTQSIAADQNNGTHVSQREYVVRESASEAAPLRLEPDDVIEGSHGLTRCELLNDRRHALSIDTKGEIALWDIVEARCLGIFADEEDLKTSLKVSTAPFGGSDRGSGGGSGRDVLELVKERIEGEVSIATWCQCDTRVGALTVHLEEGRAFDAEIYADEAHLPPPTPLPDARLNLGKWVLRHLFKEFIEAELEARSTVPHAGVSHHPNFISMPPTTLRRAPSSRYTPKTPGMTIALATPALSRAVIPELPTPPDTPTRNPLFPSSEISATNSGQRTPSGARTPTASRAEGDYFSLPPATTLPMETSNGKSGEVTPATPTTPSGTRMGRFKFLGKSKKNSEVEQPARLSPILQDETAEEGKIIRTPQEEQQFQALSTIFSQPLTPCPLNEAPPLAYEETMAILISEETADASAWAVTYRGLVGTGRDDVQVLEQKAPFWLLDYLLGARVSFKEPVKASFVIHPWLDPLKAGLPEIPNSNARLTANRNLRVHKIASYIAAKLDLRPSSRAASISGSSQHSVMAPLEFHGEFETDRLEILCGDVVLPLAMTLATIRALYWKSGGDILINYRYAGAAKKRH